MLNEFLGENKELIIYCTQNLMRKTLDSYEIGMLVGSDNCICIFPREGTHPAIAVNDKGIITTSYEDEDYINNYFLRINLNQEEENKVITLLTLGLDFKDIIYLNFIKDKEDELQWENYRDFESDQ